MVLGSEPIGWECRKDRLDIFCAVPGEGLLDRKVEAVLLRV